MRPLRSGTCVRCKDITNAHDYKIIVEVMSHVTANNPASTLNWGQYTSFYNEMIAMDRDSNTDADPDPDPDQWFIGINSEEMVVFFTADANSVSVASQDLMCDAIHNLDIRTVDEFKDMHHRVLSTSIAELLDSGMLRRRKDLA